MNKFDLPSFWSGVFIGILMVMLYVIVIAITDGAHYRINVPEACQYAEDLCYPEYDGERWSIVEGER